MKLSLNWLGKYLKTDLESSEIAEILTTIGLEVEGSYKVESLKGGLEGFVVGEVLTCVKHPDADRLSMTTVEVGLDAPLQIVCGAPNVAIGQKVVVALEGSKIYPKEGDPWTIKKGKIRGVDSQGMICAEDELGIGSSHDGIIVLPSDVKVGTKAKDYYGVTVDHVLEIGLTPNRSDATSHLGVARDILAYLKTHHNYLDEIIDPDFTSFITEKVKKNIDVDIEDNKRCIRYSGVTINNVKVGPSPQWLVNLLSSIDIKPINNIVDITNFVLHELGQPLHAFDADQIDGDKIIVKTLPEKTPFVTLDGVQRELYSEDLMICDAQHKPLTIAGVYGGLHSGISETTVNIFLESASFDSFSIRKTSTRHNLRTDAAKIFEKGSDPNITVTAIKRAAALIKSIAGGAISNVLVDIYPKPVLMTEVRLRYSKINQVAGFEIPKASIHSILQAMEMEVAPFNDDGLIVKIPTNKVDVLREIDVIEEIIRIFGLNNIPIYNDIKSTLTYSSVPNRIKIKEIIANYASASGFNEIMGISLMESKYFENSTIYHDEELVKINNTSNVHLDIMRPSLLVSGLLSVAYNINRQQTNLRLYEFGKSYLKSGKKYIESEGFGFFLAGKTNAETWLDKNKADVDFYDIKHYIKSFLQKLGIVGYTEDNIQNDSYMAYGLEFRKGPMLLAKCGEVNKSTLQLVGIKSKVFYGELIFDSICKLLGKQNMTVQEFSKFPTTRRDLALVLDKNVTYAQVEQIIRTTQKDWLKHINLFDVYENEDHLGQGKKSYAISMVFENPNKTLQDSDIEPIIMKIRKHLEEKLNVQIRE